MKNVNRFFQDEEGVTAIEYTLIAAGIALAIVAVVFVVGNQLETFFGRVSGSLGRTS